MIEYKEVTALLRDEHSCERVGILLDGFEPCDPWGVPLISTGEVIRLIGWGEVLDGVGEVFTNSGGREIVVPQRFIR